MAHTESSVVHIFPAQQCNGCPRLTNVAILNKDQGTFFPVCPLHGYVEPFSPQFATRSELERQFESIRRFVVWMYGEQGYCSIVSPICNLDSIPGYPELPEQQEEDRGFFVGYHAPAGDQAEVYVVWSANADQFFLYSDGREIKDRACTWVESKVSAS